MEKCNYEQKVNQIYEQKWYTRNTHKKKKKAVGGFLGILASIFVLFFFDLGLDFDLGLFSLSLTTLCWADLFICSLDLTLNTIFLRVPNNSIYH